MDLLNALGLPMDDSGLIIDVHVHIAGTNEPVTNCYFNRNRLRALGFRAIKFLHGIKNFEENGLEAELEKRLQEMLDDPPLNIGCVVLSYDWARDESGFPLRDMSDFYVPDDYVFNLAGNNPRIFPGVSIHPFAPDSLERLNYCAERGAVLVKWLPTSQNFSPEDPRCRPFLHEMARLKMPLLCHTGSEGATRNFNKRVNNPKVLQSALNRGVTVIAAHCGMRSTPFDEDYFDYWHSMLKDYPHLYGDTSSVFGLRARRFVKALDKEGVVERLVHGSDWPVPGSPWWFVRHIGFEKALNISHRKNLLIRDILTKQALGLPEEVFTRAAKLLRLQQTA